MRSLKALMLLLVLALSLNLAACQTTVKSQSHSQSGAAKSLGVQGPASRGANSGFPTDAYWAD